MCMETKAYIPIPTNREFTDCCALDLQCQLRTAAFLLTEPPDPQGLLPEVGDVRKSVVAQMSHVRSHGGHGSAAAAAGDL